MTRKRAASSNLYRDTAAATHSEFSHFSTPRFKDLKVDNIATNEVVPHGNGDENGGFGREQVCLCQPDPKIPRPRNGIYRSFLVWHTTYVILL